jgi:hypothetical protein
MSLDDEFLGHESAAPAQIQDTTSPAVLTPVDNADLPSADQATDDLGEPPAGADKQTLMTSAGGNAGAQDGAPERSEPPPSGQEAKLRAAVGGLVQVVPMGRGSKELGAWTWAHLAAITDGSPPAAMVLYGARKRVVQLEPQMHQYLRQPIPVGGVAEVFALGGWVGATLASVEATEAILRYGRRTKTVRLGDPGHDPKEIMRWVEQNRFGESVISSASNKKQYLGESAMVAAQRKVLYMELKLLAHDVLCERAELEGVPTEVIAPLAALRDPQEGVIRSVLEHLGLVPTLAPPEPELETQPPTPAEVMAAQSALVIELGSGTASMDQITEALEQFGPWSDTIAEMGLAYCSKWGARILSNLARDAAANHRSKIEEMSGQTKPIRDANQSPPRATRPRRISHGCDVKLGEATVKTISRLLRRYPMNISVQTQGLGALASMLAINHTVRDCIVALGGIDLVIGAMQRLPRVEIVLTSAIASLIIFAHDSGNANAIRAGGGLSAALDATHRFPRNAALGKRARELGRALKKTETIEQEG